MKPRIIGLDMHPDVFTAAARLDHFWKDHPASKRQLWLLKVFCSTMFWKDKLKSGLNRKLDASPLLWLYSYSWRTRMVKWAWFLTVLLAEIFIFNAYLESLYGGPTLMTNQFLLSSIITIGLAFTAVNSFRMERQNGALELLLTTPLRESQLINGRLSSLCRHFLPTVILVAVVCVASAESDLSAFVGNWIVTLFTVTCIGLWLSLTRLNQMSAWCITVVVTLLVPQMLLYYFFANDNWSSEFGRVFGSAQSRGGSIAIIQIFMGFEALRRAKRKLVSRTF